MTGHIDHAAFANDLLEVTDDRYSDFERAQFVAQAQAHATLALVEQQRIANLIALVGINFGGAGGADITKPWDAADDTEEWRSIQGSIKEALGL